MAEVTVKGSLIPCAEFPRGKVRTVQYTDHIQRLIDGGFVEVVDWVDEPKPKRAKKTPKPVEPIEPVEAAPYPDEVADEPATERELIAERADDDEP